MSGSRYVMRGGAIFEITVNPQTKEETATKMDAQDFIIGSNGEVVPIRDKAERARQTNVSSHTDFFNQRNETAAQQKQRLRRLDALSTLPTRPENRVKDAHGPNIRTVSDEDYAQMRLDLKNFRPLNTYVHLLTTKSGAVVRPVLSGEVGMYKDRNGEEKICILEAGEKNYSTGGKSINQQGENE